jgi:hypothetical protein
MSGVKEHDLTEITGRSCSQDLPGETLGGEKRKVA